MQGPLQEFVGQLASGRDQPQTSFEALFVYSRHFLPVRLFTMTEYDEAAKEAVRIYSNMPAEYPVTGRKPVAEGHWTAEVIKQRRIFVANDYQSIAAVFPDHEKIRSLGCESVVNIPIAVSGTVLGTINCLDKAGAYSRQAVAAASALLIPGASCFLLSAALSRRQSLQTIAAGD